MNIRKGVNDMLSDDEMREELRKANETGKYYLYGNEKRLDSMSHEELKAKYLNMRNYLSDIATHDN